MVWFKAEYGRVYEADLKRMFTDGIDGRLRAILLELGNYTKRKFNIPITITCLNRTKEENEKVGGSKYSAHLYGRGADIRTRVFSQKEIKKIVKHLERVWGDMLFILVHNVNSGMHLHVNIKYKYRMD